MTQENKDMESQVFCRSILHSSSVTPPIIPGTKLKFVPVDRSDDVSGMVTIKPEDDYSGLYTNDLADCIAISIVERDADGKIINLSMVHCYGGINKIKLDQILSKLNGLPENYYRELIVAGGNTFQSMNHFLNSLPSYFNSMSIDEYLNQQSKLSFRTPCKYTLVPGLSGTACVTFDGYAGPLYETIKLELKNETHVIIPSSNIDIERNEFDKIKFELKHRDLQQIQDAIEAAGCTDEVRAQIYLSTRELIFKTQFNPELNQSQSHTNAEVKKLFQQYKKQIYNLPRFSNTELILNAVAIVLFLGIPLSMAYVTHKAISRNKARKILIEESSFQKPKF